MLIPESTERYQCLMEMIKMSSQDRLLGVEYLRLRWKEKESSWSIEISGIQSE